ncbi:MAG: 4-alpha-glucanotransferase [Segetibacter sp.]|nr:4-alpha-glucanotransferase [Segetibacter sp.]
MSTENNSIDDTNTSGSNLIDDIALTEAAQGLGDSKKPLKKPGKEVQPAVNKITIDLPTIQGEKKGKDEKPANRKEKSTNKKGASTSDGSEFHAPIQPATIQQKFSAEKKPLKKVTFKLRFHTKFGQRLFITGNHALLGNNSNKDAVALTYLNKDFWFLQVEFPLADVTEPIAYRYKLVYEDESVAEEFGGDKLLDLSAISQTSITIVDTWNFAGYDQNTFYTEPFKKVLLKENYTPVKVKEPKKVSHHFKIKSPLLSAGQTICLLGGAYELRDWDTTDPILLSREKQGNWFEVKLDLSKTAFPVLYKYGVYDVNKKAFVEFEVGSDRELLQHESTPDNFTVLADGFINISDRNFKGAGVAIPVFSLRSNESLGVGEFNDLKLLVDWAKTIGLKLVQILPINDTTATYTTADSYPYAAISAFALHPIYLHLPAVVNKKNRKLLDSLHEQQKLLNAKSEVDYVAVMKTKLDIIKQIFPLQKKDTFKDNDFLDFFRENKHWLVPYAAFSFLRDTYQTADFSNWREYNVYNTGEIEQLASEPMEVKEEISVYYFIQYYLHLQLLEATAYAHENGIIVKGDIPIGIYRYSCDAWQAPQLYHIDKQAGAPPDDFAVKGQNWGFPTYNWQQMQQDGFQWWKKRFAQMSYYFDAFRIDHILGFFRIWSIPMHAVEGILGYFVPALPVNKTEFEERGISFNTERFTKPFINDAILQDLFNNEVENVITTFLVPVGDGTYQLKPEFDTQRKVEAHFEEQEASILNRSTKQGLFDLISNVLLFEADEPGSNKFHFRIALEKTPSFLQLDNNTQEKLRALSIDYFFKRQDEFWEKEAMRKLPELKRSTNMLICGEDLGMVPDCVPGVMKRLAILSLEIQRMPKDPKKEFFHPNDAPYLSVVTPSTHDMSTIRGWWEEDRKLTQHFYNTQLVKWGDAPYFCEPEICHDIVLQHLYSPAMWSIFQLQDLLSINGKIRRENPHEERINIPADPKHYWRYRMHLNLEDLLKEKEFNKELHGYVQRSGR